MSGILSSLSNVVSQSRLSRAGHKLLLLSANSVLHPTAYYHLGLRSQSERLALPQDVFELSLVCHALTRQSNGYQNLLSETEVESVQQEINTRIEANLEEVNANLEDINRLFKQSRYECPVQSVADILYTLASSSSREKVSQFTPTLFAVLKEKLDYLSAQNAADILSSIVKLGLVEANSDLVKKVVEVLARKDFTNQLEPVVNHAWTINQYEEQSSANDKPLNIINCKENTFAAYIRAGGNTSILAKTKLTVQDALDQLVYRVINPIFFRESRITRRFEARDQEQDANDLTIALNQIVAKLPETAHHVTQIRAKY